MAKATPPVPSAHDDFKSYTGTNSSHNQRDRRSQKATTSPISSKSVAASKKVETAGKCSHLAVNCTAQLTCVAIYIVLSDFKGIGEIKRQFGRLPCAPFHLEGGCPHKAENTCLHLHEEIAFKGPALERYRRFVYNQPCPRGLACRPDSAQRCKLKHTCPWGAKCVFAPRRACVFDASLFQGQGHQPNVASELNGERCVADVSAIGAAATFGISGR